MKIQTCVCVCVFVYACVASFLTYLANFVAEIIEKHGLDDLFDTTGNLSNELPLDEEKKIYFSDQKLQSMWKRAEQAGFSGMSQDSSCEKSLFSVGVINVV